MRLAGRSCQQIDRQHPEAAEGDSQPAVNPVAVPGRQLVEFPLADRRKRHQEEQETGAGEKGHAGRKTGADGQPVAQTLFQHGGFSCGGVPASMPPKRRNRAA